MALSPAADPAWRAPVVLVHDEGLAAVLGALDFPEDPRGGFSHVSGDAQGCRFSFCSRSRCGTWSLAEIKEAWNKGPAFCEEEPDHPVSYIIAFVRWRLKIEELKRRPPAHYEQRGQSSVLIDPSDPISVQEELCRKIGI